MIFFTGDEHFGHKNVIKYCNRPFSDVDEMDREIIKRHNEVVGDAKYRCVQCKKCIGEIKEAINKMIER